MDNASRLGPYRFIRSLEPVLLEEGNGLTRCSVSRVAAVHDRDNSSHLLYFIPSFSRPSKRAFLSAAESLAALKHPHLLAAEAYSLCQTRGGCIISPFPGSHQGLLTLRELLRLKGGQMNQVEARRAITQLLGALSYAHTRATADGALTLDRVQVDTRGCLRIELFGFSRTLCHSPASLDAAVRDDVRTTIAIATSILAGEPHLSANPLLEPKTGPLDRRLLGWMAEGLDPTGGFPTADAALAALVQMGQPTTESPRMNVVRTVLDRIRSVVPVR